MVNIVINRNCVYQTAYHVIWCPKYRRDVLTGAVAEEIGLMLDAICTERDWPVISREIQPDHIHLLVSIPPAIAVAKAQKALGRIRQEAPVLESRFDRASVHFDKRTYSLRGEAVSLNTLSGRMVVPLRLGDHQRRILESGAPKEAELIFRKGRWYFNLVVESGELEPVASGQVMGVDVGEINLAAVSTGKVFGGGRLRDRRDRHLALRRRLQSNGSRSAKQKLGRL